MNQGKPKPFLTAFALQEAVAKGRNQEAMDEVEAMLEDLSRESLYMLALACILRLHTTDGRA
jgi:hypothetical protein